MINPARLISIVAMMAISLVMPATLSARTVTDHDGQTVEVPDDPQRIVSLHDWTLTVMARELGAPLVASTGRLAPDGSAFIRGGRELFGLDFSQVELASIHGKPDLERIRALKPDLIVANSGDYAALRDQLSTIAPTLMFNPENGKPALALYREFAAWIGRAARYEALEAAYRARVAALRARLPQTEDRTYAAILANGRDGTLTILKEYGPLTTVLDDLGFQRVALADTVPDGQSRMTIGAELLGEIDADLIVTSYLPEQQQSEQSILSDLDQIAPGWREFLRAHSSERVISFSRYEVYPPSFRGADILLEKLEPLLR